MQFQTSAAHVAFEAVIETVNCALEAGDWAQVVVLTTDLYALAMAAGEVQFAELVQDMHWIAQDALVRPLEVAALVQP